MRAIHLLLSALAAIAVPIGVSAQPIEEITIEELHAGYREKRFSVVEVVEAHLARIEAYDKQGPLLNSIVNVNPNAVEEARRLDALLAAGGDPTASMPLFGVPVIVKDNLDAVGMPMTSGFQGWKNYYPPSDSPVVAKIKAAGGIVLAKSSLSEFARGGGDNINSVVPGYARNPYHTAYATGGSSGGTGAAIAASFGVVGIGTDTGGSVRMPAAHNALAGLRPTVGLVSRSGMVPLNSVRDTAGPMARTVKDMAILLDVIVGPDPEDPATASADGHIADSYSAGLSPDGLRGARLGVLRQVFAPDRTDPRIIENFEKTIAELRAAGAEIIDPFIVPELDTIPRPPQTAARFKDDLEKFIAKHPGIPYPSMKEIADSGLAHPLHQRGLEEAAAALPVDEDPETIEGLKNEERFRQAFLKAMDEARVDALVFPTWAQLPAINGDRNTQIGEPKPGPNAGPTRLGSSLTFVGSMLQWPAISVPNGYLGEGLPAGLQILGRAWDEQKIVNYAYAYEQATRYRKPPPTVPPLPAAKTSMSRESTSLGSEPFELLEASIEDIQSALLAREITAVELVQRYLQRIKAYNGACVREPEGILGPVVPIAHAGQINALSTLNLRPATREALGFDARKARSMTDPVDADPGMPDALEVAAALDAVLAETGKLVGPLHGVVLAIKDQFDTFDMRTTSGADAAYANDRPPDDATFVKRLREAGAIILAKANMGEYAAGMRSSFGGTLCNPYDTTRSPGGSSGGSGSAVAVNLVTCAIAEESGPSIRSPAKNNNVVGLSPTQELVSRDGMIPASFMNDRVGPICRNVQDVARILEVIAGYDPKDELTAFSVGYEPSAPYSEAARPGRLDGVRIGVLREYMDKSLFTAADVQSIEIVERALPALAALGAEIVDPGPGGALFQSCLAKYAPHALHGRFIAQHADLFPPNADHVPTLVELFFDSARFPNGPSIRDLVPVRTVGDRRYMLNRYLAERGDPNIRSIDDLIVKSKFYQPSVGFQDKKETLMSRNTETTLDVSARLDFRAAVRQIVMQCMGEQQLDALTYPTSNIPAPKLGAPNEPTVNGRPANAWSMLGQQGFPAITVPAGFTTEVYDRVPVAGAEGSDNDVPSELVGPVPARLPVGIDFLARPFGEPILLRIAAAYESATKHREVPPGFGALPDES